MLSCVCMYVSIYNVYVSLSLCTWMHASVKMFCLYFQVRLIMGGSDIAQIFPQNKKISMSTPFTRMMYVL